MAAMAAVSGTLARPVKSADGSGILNWEEISGAIHANDAPYYVARTGLIALENSHNLAGGTVLTKEQTEEICVKAHALRLPVHLDGARIFNAAVAQNETVADLSKSCDSVQFCLSKGLGAPIGSMLVGSKDFIAEARAWRKLLGGGMRQVGVLAAAGLIALEETPKILHIDHENARTLAEGAANLKGVSIDAERVATNIVIFDVSNAAISAGEVCAQLKEHEILASAFGNSIRMVTHYDVSKEDVEKTLKTLSVILGH